MTLRCTSSPWYVARKFHKTEDGQYVDDGYDKDGGVFYVWDEQADTIVQPCNEGDAFLIAAAPDMLAAITEFIEDVELNNGRCPLCKAYSIEKDYLYQQLVAAKRKAEGKCALTGEDQFK